MQECLGLSPNSTPTSNFVLMHTRRGRKPWLLDSGLGPLPLTWETWMEFLLLIPALFLLAVLDVYTTMDSTNHGLKIFDRNFIY